ncbi:MAG: hypothetical protein KR126chlam4_00601 [Candidatus Anoxychlamydiales bacterium]|uniref:Uncharacterized protein n=1 Tax=marine sediment metagenome TaxID=412755 RepID=A0A0F9B607_9ZZZZ|nr:hypothetical protein [Candidatus Anoxychlamydiales bacterium]HEU64356.1 ankyrin repeat domain-containing protein [Chlamydiota bacterium]
MFLPVRPEYNYDQVFDSFSHDPFLNYHGQISQEKFLKIYEAIPRSLKYAYLTIRDRYGNTILHYFAKEGAFELVRETFSYLEDVEKYHCTCFKNDIGQTPLH